MNFGQQLKETKDIIDSYKNVNENLINNISNDNKTINQFSKDIIKLKEENKRLEQVCKNIYEDYNNISMNLINNTNTNEKIIKSLNSTISKIKIK